MAVAETYSPEGKLTETEILVRVFEAIDPELVRRWERARLKRSLRDSLDTDLLDGGRGWDPVIQFLSSAGYRCRLIDCSAPEVLKLARSGGKFILKGDTADDWMAVTGASGSKLHVYHPTSSLEFQWITPKQFTEHVASQVAGQVRCLLVEVGRLTVDDHSHGYQTVKPLTRILNFIRPDRGDIFVLCVLAFFTGMMALATPLAVESLVSTVAFSAMLQPIIVLSIILFVFLAASAILRVFKALLVEILQRRFFARVSLLISQRIPRLDVGKLSLKNRHELADYFYEIVTIQKVFAQLLLEGVTLILNLLIGMAVLATYHPWLLGVDAFLLAMLAFTVVVLGRGAVRTAIEESKAKYKMSTWLNALLDSPLAFRHPSTNEFARERTDSILQEYLQARARHFRVLMRQFVFSLGLQVITSSVLLGFGGWLVVSERLTLGQLVAAELIVALIISAFTKLIKHFESFYDVCASMDKIGIILDFPLEPDSGVSAPIQSSPAEVTFENVEYHDHARGGTLHNLNFTIPAEGVVALSSHESYASTLVFDLLFKLRSADAGRILLNDLNYRETPTFALRQFVELVRKPELIPGTIAENIHLFRNTVSLSDINKALDFVGLTEVVRNLKDGIETQLDPNGYPLTYIQQVKLTIARAIANTPSLLLLDGVLDLLPPGDAIELMNKLLESSHGWSLVYSTTSKTLRELAPQQIHIELGSHESH